jgi:hypothetical protein
MINRPRSWYFSVLPLAARDRGWTEGYYRGRLAAHGARLHEGRYSASTLSSAQLAAVLQELMAEGFVLQKPKGGGKPKTRADWRAPRLALLRRLWGRLVDLGEIRAEDTEAALEHWAKSHTGADKLSWAPSDGLNKAVEGLKDWVKRAERRAG